MRELHIYDMMAYIHAGHVNKYSYLNRCIKLGASWENQEIPTGGCSLLFNELYKTVGKGDIVVVTDRDPIVKKEMIAGYKANRHHDRGIEVDKLATEYILQQCNVPLIARVGYEADDIAYTLVEKFKDEYDHIYLYTGDSDWYFMVSPKVSVRPSNSRAKAVDMDNFADVVGYPYNLMTLSKICFGDASDNIPGLPKDKANLIWDKLATETFRYQMGKKEALTNVFKAWWPSCLPQIDNVFPLWIDDVPDEFVAPNMYAIRNFGAAIHNKLFSGRKDASFNIQEHIDNLCEQGIYMIKEV